MDEKSTDDFGESELDGIEGISQNKTINYNKKYAPKNLYDKCIGKAKKYKENGKSLGYIGKHFKVSRTTVMRWFQKAEGRFIENKTESKYDIIEKQKPKGLLLYKIYGNPFWQYGMLMASGYGKEIDKEARVILQKSCDKKY